MTEEPATESRTASLISTATSVVAPLSLITALLFYFGYASARAQYAYFGIDVDTIGLSTQDYVMRSPQPLLTPLLGFLLIGVVAAVVHEAVRRRIAAARDDAEDADAGAAVRGRRRLQGMRRTARAVLLAGWGLLVAGVVLLAAYGPLRAWPPYALVCPALMATGAALALYGRRLARMVGPDRGARRPAGLAIALVLTASVFWATATLAEWSGRGSARDAATHLDRFPSVIVDTKERLYLTSPGIDESALAPADGQTFRYRYRNFRLLIQGHDRLFLVPPRWSPSDSTLVVPMDGSVRLQFRFQNSPP